MIAGGAAGTSLLEREHELARLATAIADTAAGRGQVVVIEGVAGIGKSRLLAAACAQGEAAGVRVLEARGLELERDAPFGVAIDLLAAPAAALAADARHAAGQVGPAAALLGLGVPGTTSLRAQPQYAQDPYSLMRSLRLLIAALARGPEGGPRPLLIAVDDAQWADRPSMALIAHVAARLESLPVMVLLTVRTGEPAVAADVIASLQAGDAVTRLQPARLTGTAVGALVAEQLPDPEPQFVAACAAVSGGNPFLTRELVRALRDGAVAPRRGSVRQVAQLVPSTVLQHVLTRLERLGEPAQRLAGAIAVLGDEAALRHAARLADLPMAVAEDTADALTAAGILTAEGVVRFAHPLLANAVYCDLPAFARARAHRRAAALLQEDGAPLGEVAAHLLVSTPKGDAGTSDTLRAAAREALARGDPQAAVRLCTRALEEPPPPDARASVLLELAAAEALRGSREAEQHATEALQLADAPAARAAALRELGRVRLALDDHHGAAQALRDLRAMLAPDDPMRQQVLAEYLSVSLFRIPLSGAVDDLLRDAITAARGGSPPDDPGLLAHLALQMTFAGDPPATIRALAERAVRTGPLMDLGSHGLLLGILVQALCAVDALDLAERIADEALVVATRHGALHATSSAHFHRAIARYHRGALAGAMADVDQALAPSREGWEAGAAWTRTLLVQALLERGDVAGARAALEPCAPHPDSMDAAIVRFAAARVALAEHDPANALRLATSAGRHLADGFGVDHAGLVPWRQVAALAARAVGEHELARELVDEGLEQAHRLGVARVSGIALRTAAALADDDRRVGLLADAADAMRESPSLLERLHIDAELGRALGRTGRRDDARALLRSVLQRADEMQVEPVAELALNELRAMGARPRRAAFTGVGALTPAEQRVAQLAAGGLTNRQIAQELFVSGKTVQTHLAHVYRKLDISSRQDLPAALQADQKT